MATTFDLADVKRRMQGAINAFKNDLGSLRTGRASPNLLDPIQIDAYGSMMPITQVATINVPEPRLLSVQVWDRGMVAAVEKAIRESDLGLNPQTEGQVIRLRIPEMTEQRRKEMVKVAHKYAEEARLAEPPRSYSDRRLRFDDADYPGCHHQRAGTASAQRPCLGPRHGCGSGKGNPGIGSWP
jgi:ribosome recycling factor